MNLLYLNTFYKNLKIINKKGSYCSTDGYELWGLDTHPLNSNIFITAGDDGYVKVYNLERKELVCNQII